MLSPGKQQHGERRRGSGRCPAHLGAPSSLSRSSSLVQAASHGAHCDDSRPRFLPSFRAAASASPLLPYVCQAGGRLPTFKQCVRGGLLPGWAEKRVGLRGLGQPSGGGSGRGELGALLAAGAGSVLLWVQHRKTPEQRKIPAAQPGRQELAAAPPTPSPAPSPLPRQWPFRESRSSETVVPRPPLRGGVSE